MFSIFGSVILVFPKHSNCRSFWSNSRRNHKNRQIKNIRIFLKTLGRSRKKIQEASRDFTRGKNSVPKTRGKLLGRKHLQWWKNRENWARNTQPCI